MSVNSHGRIQPGTRVKVRFVEKSCPGAPHFFATLVGRPSDVGDTFRFRLDDGDHLEVNPNSSAFLSIEEVAEADAH